MLHLLLAWVCLRIGSNRAYKLSVIAHRIKRAAVALIITETYRLDVRADILIKTNGDFISKTTGSESR